MEGIGQVRSNKRRRLSARAWREVLRRFDTAAVTVDEFCRDEGLSRSSFNRWRSRLQTRPANAQLDPSTRGQMASASSQPSQPSSARAPSPFLDLGVLSTSNASTHTASPAASPAGTLDLRIDLGGGIVLHLVRH